MTLKQVHGYAIKPSRYWNETCVTTVSDHVLYALAEYCPGMPREADIVASNRHLGIHPYYMLENISKYDDAGKRTEPNIEATITALITFGTIPNREQRARSRGSHGEGPTSHRLVLLLVQKVAFPCSKSAAQTAANSLQPYQESLDSTASKESFGRR